MFIFILVKTWLSMSLVSVSLKLRKYTSCLGVFHLDLSFLFVQTVHAVFVVLKAEVYYSLFNTALQVGICMVRCHLSKMQISFFSIYFSNVLKFSKEKTVAKRILTTGGSFGYLNCCQNPFRRF